MYMQVLVLVLLSVKFSSFRNYSAQENEENVMECKYTSIFIHTHIHARTHTHIYIYIFLTFSAFSCKEYFWNKENLTDTCIYVYIYTECPRRNVKYFGRVFLMLNYTDITQNTYIQSWTVTEITAREVWNFDICYTLTDYQIHIETGRNMWFL